MLFPEIFFKERKEGKDIEIENIKFRLRKTIKSMINISLHEHMSVRQCHNKFIMQFNTTNELRKSQSYLPLGKLMS